MCSYLPLFESDRAKLMLQEKTESKICQDFQGAFISDF